MSAPSQFRQRLIFALKLGVALTILTYLILGMVRDGQFADLLERRKRWDWVALGVVACVATHVLSFARWQMMLKTLGISMSLLDSIRVGLIGLFFGIFAFGVIGGDSLRAFYATRKSPGRLPEAITSVAADRLIGLITMFSVASVAFLFVDPSTWSSENDPEIASFFQWIGWTVTICTALGLMVLAGLMLSPKIRTSEFFQQLASRPRLGPLIAKVMDMISLYRRRWRVVLLAFGMSLGVNLGFVLTIYSLGTGLLPDAPGFDTHFVIEPIAMVSNAIPTPGGVGGMELAMKYLYLAFGSGGGVIVGFALRSILLVIAGTGGIAWFLHRDQMRDLNSAAAGTVRSQSLST